MKIGVISDTHIPEKGGDLPQIILDEFKKVDMVIHAGDLADLSVLNRLKSVCGNVKAVCGNMDSDEVKEKLPKKEILKLGNFMVGVMHGWGPPSGLINLLTSVFKDANLDMIIFGHSHSTFNEKIGRTIFFNPGSPTDKVFAPYNSYGIIEINDKIKARIIKI